MESREYLNEVATALWRPYEQAILERIAKCLNGLEMLSQAEIARQSALLRREINAITMQWQQDMVTHFGNCLAASLLMSGIEAS